MFVEAEVFFWPGILGRLFAERRESSSIIAMITLAGFRKLFARDANLLARGSVDVK